MRRTFEDPNALGSAVPGRNEYNLMLRWAPSAVPRMHVVFV